MEKSLSDSACTRVRVHGKFLYAEGNKLLLKGTTYGTFCPDENGNQFPSLSRIEQDFRMMHERGFTCVRTYTAPSLAILDLAYRYKLRVMVGLPWEQHLLFMDPPERTDEICSRIRQQVKACKGHPGILCYAIGNEIPASVVRWYGKSKVEAFLKRLYKVVKSEDPYALVTYVNYPTTEYLDLSFLDFCCYNVYLETPEKLTGYLARLHNLIGDKPLVMAEIGLDSLRNGTQKQASTLKWQIETIFGRGCAGMFIFSWTDEWWRGGSEIEDWDFGLVDRHRNPKPALDAVSRSLQQVPVDVHSDKLPFISVVICTYNGSSTIQDSLEALALVNYPSFEVLVVDDGSTDALAAIVSKYPVTLIRTSNRGLSNARNTGLYRAKGEIVVYLDDDAYPDPDWLCYLAWAYQNTSHAAIGGPNLCPPEDGLLAQCVANAPGGPVHVLLSDEIAEHIPGCNMSFRRADLLAIGGFDPIYRAAGDDVDVCWRIQQAGKTIGYHPSALVWHHRRNSIQAYWKQQVGYGKAEALLEAKWPEKYNSLGHLRWAGRIYGNGITQAFPLKKERIFYGSWGTALFQSVYQPAQGLLSALPLMPEWYLLSLLFAILGLGGFFWPPLMWSWALLATSLLLVIAMGYKSASRAIDKSPHHALKQTRYFLLITLLHIIQPIARLYGRIKHGLTPWRNRGISMDKSYLFRIRTQVFSHWSETWRSPEAWLSDIETQLLAQVIRVRRGGDFDEWDLQTRNGNFSSFRILATIEEYGGGKQHLHLKVWRKPTTSFLILGCLFSILAGLSVVEGYVTSGFFMGLLGIGVCIRYLTESAITLTAIQRSVQGLADNFISENQPSFFDDETVSDPESEALLYER